MALQRAKRGSQSCQVIGEVRGKEAGYVYMVLCEMGDFLCAACL